MSWLIVIIIAYFLFATSFLIDRYLLTGPLSARVYVFYVGILGASSLLLIPFVNFSILKINEIVFCFLGGAAYIFALFGLFYGLERFEASTIVPAIGGFLPVFSFFLVYFFSGGKEVLTLKESLALIFLTFGSIIIYGKGFLKIPLLGLKISFITAIFLSISLLMAKYAFSMFSFWNGFIWIRIGAFFTVLFFIFNKEVRKEIFIKKPALSKKTFPLFLFNQLIGAGAFVLQNWAIAIAGLVYLPLINALQGIQYIFLFFLTLLFLNQNKDKKAIFQKFIAILFIGLGLMILGLDFSKIF